MPEAKKGDTVKVHYTGKFSDGEVFDSSKDKPPLEFTLGEGQVITGFESGITGLQPGQKATLRIKPEEAYGNYHKEMVMEVDKSNFPPDIPLKVGEHLELGQPDGKKFIVRITDVGDQAVTLDANHPLAGRELVFDVELVEIL